MEPAKLELAVLTEEVKKSATSIDTIKWYHLLSDYVDDKKDEVSHLG